MEAETIFYHFFRERVGNFIFFTHLCNRKIGEQVSQQAEIAQR